MGQSWDHAIAPIPAEDTARREAQEQRWKEQGFTSDLRKCRAAKTCHERSAYYVWWRYVTGSRGRVSEAERPVCRAHAEAFARKYGVAMPAEGPARSDAES